MGKFGNKRIPKFMMGEPIPESHEGRSIHPEILSLSGHGDDHAMILIKTHDGQEVELRFDYDGDGMLIAQHGDHEYSIPVEVEIVSGMEESSQVDEISNAVKRSAFIKAWDKEKELDPEKEGFRRNKVLQQARSFETHISPEIKREAQSIASMFGDDVTAEVKKTGMGSSDDYQQSISIEFHEARGIFARIVIYSDGRVDKTGQFPDNIQRRLVRFVDKVRHEELRKPVPGPMIEPVSEKLTKGQKKLDKNKNGKLDKNDFELLRKSKSTKVVESFQSFVNECWNPMEEGYNLAMSEEAKRAVKTICEEILIKEAQMCDEDKDPMHTYESYLNECGSYMTECMMEAAANLRVTEGKPATGPGNQYSVMDHALASWISHKLGPAAKNGTFSSNGTKVTFMNGGKTETYSKPVNIGASRMQNTGTWELNMDKVIFKVTVENLNVNESTAYSCDTCGERAEHEEIAENPRMRCSNCGDRNWSPEY